MMRWLWVVGASLVLLAASGGGFMIWRARTAANREAAALAEAKAALQDGRSDEALYLARQYGRLSRARDKENDPWSGIELAALAKRGNLQSLLLFYDRNPASFRDDEKASLLVARALLQLNRTAEFEKLNDHWQNDAKLPEAWFALRIDRLQQQGKHAEARRLLESTSFPGTADTSRLLRLALDSVRDNMPRAWEYLEQAYELNPKDPEVRLYRAQLLEAIGKLAEARVEYVAALLARPDDLFLRERVAEFYRRTGAYAQAIATWAPPDALAPSDVMWLHAYFFARVAVPRAGGWPKDKLPEGALRPFMEYLLNLGNDRFWDDAAFATLKDHDAILARHQEAYWLRLLELLRTGKDAEADRLLRVNPFRARAWNPELENALDRILGYRLGLDAAVASVQPIVEGSNRSGRHQFLNELDRIVLQGYFGLQKQDMPATMQNFLKGPYAIPGALLVTGWMEAALRLQPATGQPPGSPDWLPYGLAQGIRFNRGVGPALEFVEKLNSPTDAMRLLQGELLLANDKSQPGLQHLQALASKANNDFGYRAAVLITLEYLNLGQVAKARAALVDYPALARSMLGKELLARCAAADGDQTQADKLYGALEKDSVEAKAYLARRAFAAKNWARARELTQALLRAMPDDLQVRRNLQAIDEAEGKP